MKQQACSVTKRVSPDVEWAAHSGHISEAFPFVLSKPPVKLGREETVSAILDLKLMTYLRLQKLITKLGVTHRYNTAYLI